MNNRELAYKTLPEDLVNDYLSGNINSEDKYIVESLADKYDNPIEYPQLAGITLQTSVEDSAEKDISFIQPQTGEIWQSVRAFKFNGRTSEPLVEPQLFYIITNPEESFSDESEDSTAITSVMALPVSFYTQWNTQWDAYFFEGNSYFGIPFMIMTDLPTEVPLIALDKRVTELSIEDSAKVYNLHYKTLNLEYDKALFKETLTGIYLDYQNELDDRYDYRLVSAKLLTFFADIKEICCTNLEESMPENIIVLHDWRRDLRPPQEAIAAAGDTAFDPRRWEPVKSEVLYSDQDFFFRLELFKNGQVFINYTTSEDMQNPAIVTLGGRDIEFLPKKGFQFKQVLTDLRTGELIVKIKKGGKILFSGVLKIT